jgi:hypothetical protein
LQQSCGSAGDTYIFASAADLAKYPAPDPSAIVYQSVDGAYLLYNSAK